MRFEVGALSRFESGGYLVPAAAALIFFCSDSTLGALHAICAGEGCFDQVCGDVSTRERAASPNNHIWKIGYRRTGLKV